MFELGIQRIESGMPDVSKEGTNAIKNIVKRAEGTRTEVFAFSRCMKEDVKIVYDCGVKGIVV